MVEPDRVQPGLTLVTVRSRDSVELPGLKLIDRDGEVVHRWRVDPAEPFTADQFRRGIDIQDQDIHGSWLLPESGDVVVNVP
ncbi:MAG: hypothetical protein ACOC83_04985 [Gemmatimonadota bacterium]